MNTSRSCAVKTAFYLALILAWWMWIPRGLEAATPSEAALSFLRSRVGPAGLLDSFVEDRTDYSYTYDNALAAMAFLSAGDRASAQRVLDGLVGIGPVPGGGFLHRYRTTGASAGGILAAGHNAYLLQALNLFSWRTSDHRYDGIARGIADFLLTLQDSADGGLFGRIGVAWKSTENNLAAYSALNNLALVQNLPAYGTRAAQIEDFLVRDCWNGAWFLTGKSDPTIVTDVQALGTQVLGVGYANGSFWVESYTKATQRYSGKKQVTGFDLNTDRDTVWTEGTLQQALAFWLASDNARFGFYRTEAEKLRQSSGAFWAASNRGTTGFGEFFERWQAVAPTAWYLLVSNRDNVLGLLP
ncbi:MAG TPA: hypothetical protein VFS12_11165 [Terriglobia bacterium]|nr:hypothetical protein [Terriglobia bacterium]